MQQANPYFDDAATLLRTAQRHRDDLKSEPLVSAVLLYAVGIERVMKGILHAVNPVYVYKDPSFKHTVSALYQDRIVLSSKKSAELADHPNHDVLNFRESLRRAAVFSRVTQHNTSTLYQLASMRDVIAHCKLDTLDQNQLFHMAYVHGPQLIMAYEPEIGVCAGFLDGREEPDPREQEERLAAEARFRSRIEFHRSRWAAMKDAPEHRRHAQRKAEVLKRVSDQNEFYEDFECPACGNGAVLTGEVDFDIVDGEPMPQGTYPIRLECPFCDLTVEDTYELDKLGAADFLYALTAPGT